MKPILRRLLPLALTALLLLAALPSFTRGAELSARALLDKIDDLYRGESSQGTMTMAVKAAHWSRTLKMRFWSKGKEKSLIRILEPKKEAGTATLKSGNQIWNYLPKVNRVIKLSSSMMSSSWMGSHFTNDDLVKESRMSEDYTFAVSFQGIRDGRSVIEVTCIPKPDAAIVWGKVVVTVAQQDYLPIEFDYYDEEMALARVLTFSDPLSFDGRRLPSRLLMKPADKPGEHTEITYDAIRFDIDLPGDLFTLRRLQR